MKKLFCVLALLVFCSIAHAALVNNPESFEDEYFPFPGDPFYPGWESWCYGGSGGGSGSNCGAFISGDATDGDNSLWTWVADGGWGYALAFAHGNPIVPGEIYEYFFDYKLVGGGAGVFKLEFYDDLARTTQVGIVAWDPFTITTPDVWQHFSYTFRAPDDAEFVTVVVGTTGVGSTMRYDMVGLLPADCPYELEGDLDNDCEVTLTDFVLLAANWLLDCIDDPADPACVTP